MKKLKRIRSVKTPLAFNVCAMSLLGSIKGAKVNVFAVHFNGCLPFAIITLCAKQAAGAVASGALLVLNIFRCRNIPQIGKSVVISNAIDVIDICAGPCASHVEKCKPMRGVLTAKHHHFPVALALLNVARDVSCFGKVISVNLPNELASVGVIFEKIAQSFCGKVGLSHIVAPIKRWFGQKPDIAANGVGLCYYNIGEC